MANVGTKESIVRRMKEEVAIGGNHTLVHLDHEVDQEAPVNLQGHEIDVLTRGPRGITTRINTLDLQIVEGMIGRMKGLKDVKKAVREEVETR